MKMESALGEEGQCQLWKHVITVVESLLIVLVSIRILVRKTSRKICASRLATIIAE